MISTIRKVIAEGSYFEKIVDGENELYQIFTFRELKIIELIKLEDNMPTISQKLNISYETVRTHRKNILVKAKTNNSVKLINYLNNQ
ncbi:MAG: helix-turn-helix transcriptional regulator [Cytophagales bacterium]